MQNVRLNLIPGSVLPVVNVSQYDKKREFTLTIYDGATAYNLAGKSVQIRGTKPDGNGFAYDQTDGVVSIMSNVVTILTTQQMTAVGGPTMAELRITSGDTIVGTINFILMVEPSALSDDTPISDTDIPAIERDFQAALDEAEADALIAEGYAKGTQDGVPATSGEPYYQDNAKYYKEQAEAAASGGGADALKAEGYAVGTQNGVPVTSESPYYHNNAAYYEGEASTSASNASTSETNAGNSATAAAADSLEAEGWANGKQNGTPVGPGSPYYQNNAEYYAAQAGQYATGGLIFKGSVAFANIPTTGMVNGDMYNITDDFTTDSRFIEGAGVSVKAGADIAWVAGSVNKWDILALGGGSDDYSQLINKPKINSVELSGNKTAAALGLATDAAMTGASAGSAGAKGLVPAPAAGDQNKVLYGDGIWKTPSGGSDMTGATASTPGTHGLVPAPAAGDNTKFLRGDGTWAEAGGGGGGGFDYKDWLTAGDLNPMSYADLAAVLADEKAVRKLMTIHLAVDYLTQFGVGETNIQTILNNDYAAKWINLRDYALDKLEYAFSALMASIGKYGYGEWALMPQVPVMTSNTSPYGEVFANAYYRQNYEPFRAFDNDSSKYWAVEDPIYDSYIGYDFGKSVVVKELLLKQVSATGAENECVKTFLVQGSHDNNTWSDISDTLSTPNNTLGAEYHYQIDNDIAYRYYRIQIKSNWGANYVDVNTLQFYAWAPKGNVPVMTSNTAPYGTASAYQVFDGNASTTASGTDFSYKFVNPICPKDFICKNASGQNITGGTLQASNDGSTWAAPVDGEYYLNLRVHFAASTTVATVQFYGREMKVSVPVMTSNTAPYGEVIYPSTVSGYPAWKAFDGDVSTPGTGVNPDASSGAYIGYKFPSSVKIGMFAMKGSNSAATNTVKLQASDDGLTWDDTSQNTTATYNTVVTGYSDTDVVGRYCRIYQVSATGANSFGFYYIQFWGFDYSEYDWDTVNPRHYLYDHGVELETITTSGTVTKGTDAITLSAANAQATNTVDLTSYNLLRDAVGQHFSGTTQLIAGTTATANMTAANAPYNESLDISNVSASLATGAKMTSVGVCDITEMWLE